MCVHSSDEVTHIVTALLSSANVESYIKTQYNRNIPANVYLVNELWLNEAVKERRPVEVQDRHKIKDELTMDDQVEIAVFENRKLTK